MLLNALFLSFEKMRSVRPARPALLGLLIEAALVIVNREDIANDQDQRCCLLWVYCRDFQDGTNVSMSNASKQSLKDPQNQEAEQWL